jgi:fluoroquinolone transport system permease protein
MLSVIRTTPAGLARYLAARSYGYFIISIITTPILHELLGFVDVSVVQLNVLAVLAQTLLPFSALLLLNFAHNLVEGFAVMKSTGFLVSVPIILAMFVPAPWYWLAAPLPTWWTLWGYFELANGNALAIVWFLMGAVAQILITYWLWKRLMRAEN